REEQLAAGRGPQSVLGDFQGALVGDLEVPDLLDVVAPVRSVLQPQVKGLGDLEPVSLRSGESADLNRTVEALAAAAYSR
ncbi:hypothetical protein, partial [Streptomyces ossamyceticus]|uniref:hypothetical protein n=1 Tax=Streptomyces ossamyceticus TaxID=249581 RepID=UPI001F0A3495